jgi:hypothetical protein
MARKRHQRQADPNDAGARPRFGITLGANRSENHPFHAEETLNEMLIGNSLLEIFHTEAEFPS